MRRLLIILYFLLGTTITYSFFLYEQRRHQIEENRKQVEMFEIQADPYGVTVNILITEDMPTALFFVQKNTDSTIVAKDFEEADAVTFTGSGTPTIWFNKISNKPCDIEVINHELVHITYYVLNRSGITLSNSTDEVYAYELGYLSYQLYSHIK